MEPTVARTGTSLTITRSRKARLRRDAVLQVLLSRGGRRWVALVGGVAAAVGFVVAGWPGALLLGALSLQRRDPATADPT